MGLGMVVRPLSNNEAFHTLNVHVGSIFGACVLHVAVFVAVDKTTVCDLLVLVEVKVLVDVVVTFEGVTVFVFTIVAERTVVVLGGKVVSYSPVLVVVLVVTGVVVTLKMAVGVWMIVCNGCALIEKFRE
jgi:hypothetical protein